MFDPKNLHPAYIAFAPSWRLMRDAVAGEDDIKRAGEAHLPMKSGQVAIRDEVRRRQSYEAYKLRAEFPEIVAPTVRGAVGVILGKAAEIELPPQMELLRERATLDGLTLDGLHRRIAGEVMTTGRYGLLPGLSNGEPYIAGYGAESITSWDTTQGTLDYVVLNESGPERDRSTGAWKLVEKYRECWSYDGKYQSRIWTEAKGWSFADETDALTPKREVLDFLPFTFIGSTDLTADPDDVPLYGLAKLAVRAYRLDADRTWALHMTSEPTPWVNGFNDAKKAVDDGVVPQGLGSSALWILPENAEAGYLEFSGPGLERQEAAITDALDRAAQFGAQLIQQGQSAESGEALKLRAASQTATLTSVAQTTAAGLERALRNIATWIGADPMAVTVTPNLDFFDRTLSADEARAVWEAWTAGVIDHGTAIAKLKAGNWLPEDADAAKIDAALSREDEGGDDDLAGATLPQPRAEGANTR